MGAVGDGSTDDTAAINAAAAYAYTLGQASAPKGATVFFPPGNYFIGTPPVDISNLAASGAASALIVIGASRQSVILFGNTTGILFQSQPLGIEFGSGPSGLRNLTILNSNTSTTSVGVWSGAPIFNQFFIENCKFGGYIALFSSADIETHISVRNRIFRIPAFRMEAATRLIQAVRCQDQSVS